MGVTMDVLRKSWEWIMLGAQATFDILLGPPVVSIVDLTAVED